MPTDDHKVRKQAIQIVAQRNRTRLGQRFHLNRPLSQSVLAIDKYVNSLGISCRRHHVPPKPRQAVTDVEQSDVADDLIGDPQGDGHWNPASKLVLQARTVSPLLCCSSNSCAATNASSSSRS